MAWGLFANLSGHYETLALRFRDRVPELFGGDNPQLNGCFGVGEGHLLGTAVGQALGQFQGFGNEI
jgi:hypothetical protein